MSKYTRSIKRYANELEKAIKARNLKRADIVSDHLMGHLVNTIAENEDKDSFMIMLALAKGASIIFYAEDKKE